MNISPLSILRITTSRLLGLCALFACAFLPLHAASLDDLGYTTTDGKVTITDCDEAATGELVIPPTIEGNPVTSIGEMAFGNCFTITNITLPDSIVSIGNQAFTQCFSLVNITIPNSITKIGEEVFCSCTSLKSITIPDSVTSIGKAAFRSCTSLTSVTIGNGVIIIEDAAFQGCSDLILITFQGVAPTVVPDAFIDVPDEAVAYVIASTSFGESGQKWNGFTIKRILTWSTDDEEVTITFCDRTATGELIIPETIEGNPVTSIGDYAFASCTNLTSITIPDGVTSIGFGAFSRCTNLKSVTIDGITSIGADAFTFCRSLTGITMDDVTSIGFGAFASCTSLRSITIPDSVIFIGGSAFSSCTRLTSITIPDSVTSIGDSSFNRCFSLTSVTFGTNSKLTSIGAAAFRDCTGLTSITIPESVTSIGNEAFRACDGLTNIKIGNDVTSIGDSAFNGCKRLTSITIPDSVISIGDQAFLFCSGLTGVTIPKNVTSIGAKAFYDLPNLSSVYFSGNSPSIGLEAFDLAANGFAVYFNQDSRGFSSPAWKGYTAYSYAAPKFTSSPPAASAFVNAPYSHTCNATGTPSATFMVTEGFLPHGLTLSSEGLISGSPVAVGTFTGKITATNGFLEGVTQNFSIQVRDGNTNPAPLPEIRTAIEFSFDVVNGVSYRIEASTDLINWEMIETAIIGEGSRIDRFYSTRDQPNRHFRVKTN